MTLVGPEDFIVANFYDLTKMISRLGFIYRFDKGYLQVGRSNDKNEFEVIYKIPAKLLDEALKVDLTVTA